MLLKTITVLGLAATAFFSAGCEEDAGKALTHEKVVIAGKTFNLEIVADDQSRFKGLSGRDKIDPDGGMLFVFKEPRELDFVMRDCPIPIDIIFVDGAGRITAFHKMAAEPPRSEEEKNMTPPFKDAPQWTWTNEKYESRLKKYPSKFAAQYAIELKGDTLDSLKVKATDKVEFDRAAMKKLAK